MPAVLLRPSILTVKNRLFKERSDHPSVGQSLGVTMAGMLLATLVFWLMHSFLMHTRNEPELAGVLPTKLIHLYLLAFFFLLLFSNIISSLGQLFFAQDLPLILASPASPGQLYLSRLLIIVANSSGIFLLLAIPSLLAYQVAFDLPWWFLIGGLIIGAPFLLIPGAIACALVTTSISLIPTQRIKEASALLAVGTIYLLFVHGDQVPTIVGHESHGMSDAALYIALLDNPNPIWSPPRWAADALVYLMEGQPASAGIPALLLFTTAIGLTCLGYLCFDLLFKRGWTLASNSTKSQHIGKTVVVESISRILFPFCPRLRAFAIKDARMFIRDTTQALQMLLLLLLTLIYLYNFKALRSVTDLTSEGLAWWQAILAVANLALGTCVISAICTRFVFPAVSLEGRAYWLLRVTPISIADFLWFKFLVTAIPVAFVSLVLIVAGAFAAQIPPAAVLCSSYLALVLSAGTVGLAIGVGAFFARFDWNSPTQIATSIGSLVYMALSLSLVIASLIPASLMIIVTCVQSFADQFSSADYSLFIICAALLTTYLNIAALRQALRVGTLHLASLEL